MLFFFRNFLNFLNFSNVRNYDILVIVEEVTRMNLDLIICVRRGGGNIQSHEKIDPNFVLKIKENFKQ